MSAGTMVAGGRFKTNVTTGSSGWQQAVVSFTYINALTPDTLLILYSSSSLDRAPKAGSILWIDDVSVSSPTGVEEIFGDENAMTIFPNPSNGIFSINHQNDKPQTIEIFNLLGEKIYSASNTNKGVYNIDLLHSPKGIYFVEIYDGEIKHT
jgi:hypothetical protein